MKIEITVRPWDSRVGDEKPIKVSSVHEIGEPSNAVKISFGKTSFEVDGDSLIDAIRRATK